uniref:Uncharacterized protein n=1 Tax=Trichuris muris TaxID=70415 RepID=A0A5S6Q183_TRIMR
MERITRILKPTSADQKMRDALFDRISKAEKVCKEGKCKDLQAKLVAGEQIDGFAKLLQEYDECMDECRQKENRSFDLLKEIEKKSDYWKNLQEVKREMSLKDALVYWTEIASEFKILEEEEQKYDSAMEKLKLTKEETERKENLDAEIRKQDQTCKTTKCASQRQAILAAVKPEDQVSAAEEFFECRKICERSMDDKVEELDRLIEREDCAADMEEVRTCLREIIFKKKQGKLLREKNFINHEKDFFISATAFSVQCLSLSKPDSFRRMACKWAEISGSPLLPLISGKHNIRRLPSQPKKDVTSHW